MRRPQAVDGGSGPSLWDIYGWQVQTYAQLRSVQEDSLPVVAGVVLYLNELYPTATDLSLLRREITNKATDIIPQPGKKEESLLRRWREKDKPPALPIEFRLARALRVVEITPSSIEKALSEFDQVVARIEICRGKELRSGRVLSTWDKNASDDGTCAACDARTFCPEYKEETIPQLPAVRIRT